MKNNSPSVLIFSLFFVLSCSGQSEFIEDNHARLSVSSTYHSQNSSWIEKDGKNILERFKLPKGFSRPSVVSGSFHEFLLKYPLLPDGSKVKYYDGSEKKTLGVYCAVFDQDIGNKNLHQCADAVMNLRASFLYDKKMYDRIKFHFTSGDLAAYVQYAEGYRAVIQGSNVSWVKKAQKDYSYSTFRKYMDLIYSYCGTASLSKELKSVSIEEIQAGDVFIRGGYPGHAVLVLDVIENEQNEKAFLLSQSYMPAQQNQILINPLSDSKSPWFFVNEIEETLITPEWTFNRTELKRFAD